MLPIPAIILFLALCSSAHTLAAADLSARDLIRRGSDELIAGEIDKSITSFEEAIAQEPAAKPHLWQLGIAYYYARRFADGRDLFALHQTVNSHDVENAVWHFLCVARADGIDAARKKLIPISGDSRVPMRQLHSLFAGKGNEDEVLKKCEGEPTEAERKNALCYAHLYLGLYNEALGQADKSLDHLRKAQGDYAQTHYMGQVARLHYRLRTEKKL
jgi:lipoprotein NlpI